MPSGSEPSIPADIRELAGLDRSSAKDFSQLARALQAQDTVQHTLDAICELAVHLIDGADHAGITLLRSATFSTPAASGDIPRRVDQIQYATGQGPCLDAIREQEVVELPDLAAEARWPQFAQRTLAETPVRSMMSFRLFLLEDTLGALNLYSEKAGGFPGSARAMGEVFAAHAAIAFGAARSHDETENLTMALRNSRHIGAAVGILMSRHKLTEDQAFDRLRVASQATHRKLRDLADDVLMIGDLPDR